MRKITNKCCKNGDFRKQVKMNATYLHSEAERIVRGNKSETDFFGRVG